MNIFDGLEDDIVLSPEPRKRGRCEEYHERTKIKKIKYSGGGKVPQIGCVHKANKNPELCHADLLTNADLVFNSSKMYENPTKVVQDNFILSLIDVKPPKRRRKKIIDESKQRSRNVGVDYSLLTTDHPKKVKVCKETFLRVLGE